MSFTNEKCIYQILIVFLFSGHLDHGLWGSVKEDEFLKQCLLKLHFSSFSHNENVSAELQDPVNTWKFLKHDGPGDPVEELSDKLSNDQHYGHVQAHNAATKNARKRDLFREKV